MNRVIVGQGSCGIAAGANEVREALARALEQRGIQADLRKTGCIGMCHREVLVELDSPQTGPCLYGDVTPDNAEELVSTHFCEGVPHQDLLVLRRDGTALPDLLERQERVVLRNCGLIDPESLDDYIANGGYSALKQVLHRMAPDAIIEAIENSGLRGRGGGGFPVGAKWRMTRAAAGDTKYLICNGDEGDPGAFMDRNLIEGDPFSILEGMTIAAYAVGAREAYVYVRQEYPLAVERIEHAISVAREHGYLGKGVAGSSFDLEVHVKRGAGAFVCGEETALLASIEGRRGLPEPRPPYPAEKGLWDKPTLINNVETFANVPWIIANGVDAFRRYGGGKSRGTKVFSLAGDIRHGGMVEVPMGITLREIVEDIGGGSSTGKPIKAVQIGGPSGGCVPAHLFDTKIDYESLRAAGAIMGSGGLVVMDSSRCMVDVARYFLGFAQSESCGKCTFCRIGTKRMFEVMTALCSGGDADLDELEELGRQVQAGSLCGLGQTAPNAVLSTLQHFRDEYEAHNVKKCCPAGTCRDLISFEINPLHCDGCTLCFEQCVAKAISHDTKVIQLRIDDHACTRCGGCLEVCRFSAVNVR